MALEIPIIILLIICNGVLAMSELAIVSARKTRLQQRADRGETGARVALELANDPNQFLSTAQTGITLVGILAGVFGGATIAERLAVSLGRLPLLAAYNKPVSIAIVVLSITYLSLVFGELVPKRLALNNAEEIASRLARPMRWLSVIATPAVRVLSVSTEAVLRVLRVRPPAGPPVTEEEIRSVIRQGTEAGVLEETEHDMVENVFRLGDRPVSALMTPRPEIVWLDLNDSPEKIRRTLIESRHSHFPVCQGGLENVLGITRDKDLLARSQAGHPFDWQALLCRPLFVPESTRALRALELLKQSGTHIALVIDEYGGTQGLITYHDILEAIVGEVPVLGHTEEPQAVQREDGSWLLDGMLSIDEFKQLVRIDKLPGEERGDYHTLGGLVMMHMERIPTAGDYFDYGGLRFEVVDMDGRRVDKILVRRSPTEGEGQQQEWSRNTGVATDNGRGSYSP
jgi:putative hemolysin